MTTDELRQHLTCKTCGPRWLVGFRIVCLCAIANNNRISLEEEDLKLAAKMISERADKEP